MTTERQRERVTLGVNATSRLQIFGDVGRACILETLPHVILAVRADGTIGDANAAAESFFEMSKPILIGAALDKILPFGSSLLTLIAEVRERGAPINEYKVDHRTVRDGRAARRRPLRSLARGSRGCPGRAARTDNCRKNRQATHPSRRGALGLGLRGHARA